MTVETFIGNIEAYYGKYPRKRMRELVMQYVARVFKGRDLDLLFKRTLLEVSGEYKAVPDIAVFERVCQSISKYPDLTVKVLPEETMTDDERVDMGEQLRELVADLAERKRA